MEESEDRQRNEPPMPRTRLMVLGLILDAIRCMAEERLTIPEITDALIHVTDGHLMLYAGRKGSLASAIDGDRITKNSGYEERNDILYELFNMRFWENSDTIECVNLGAIKPREDLLVLDDDGLALARNLWGYFFPNDALPPNFESQVREFAECGPPHNHNGDQHLDFLSPSHPRYAPKLAAAVRAWQAVTDSGKKSPKQALEKWLREHAEEFGLVDSTGEPVNQAIEECCKVANWQPGGGAPKTDY